MIGTANGTAGLGMAKGPGIIGRPANTPLLSRIGPTGKKGRFEGRAWIGCLVKMEPDTPVAAAALKRLLRGEPLLLFVFDTLGSGLGCDVLFSLSFFASLVILVTVSNDRR